MNSDLQDPLLKKNYIFCGTEFGLDHIGNISLLVYALYGGKVDGPDFWHHLISLMKYLVLEMSFYDFFV